MTARILIDGSGFKVSKPGNNVLTAANQNLIITSGASNALGVFLTGTATGATATIPFGRTLPFIPRFWLSARINSTTWQQLSHFTRRTTNFDWGSDEEGIEGVEGIIDQTRLLIRNHGGYSLIRYVIFNTGLTP